MNQKRMENIAVLFLAQKIKVSVTAWPGIDDGGKVPGKIVSAPASVPQWEGKRDFQGDLGPPDIFPIFPGLAENRDFSMGRNCIQKRLGIAGKP